MPYNIKMHIQRTLKADKELKCNLALIMELDID